MPFPRYLLWIFLPSALLAQGAPEPASLSAPPVEELIRQALHASPMLRAGAEAAGADAETALAAGALPDPMVEVMLQNVGFPDYTVGEEEMSMLGVEVRQGLPYPGKRKAEREVGGARVATALERWERARRRSALEVRRAHAELYALDREREILLDSRDLIDLAGVVAASRYGTGEADAGAVLRAQLKGDQLAIRLDDLAALRAALVAELNALRGLSAETPLGPVGDLPDYAPPERDAIVTGSPEVAVARTLVRSAELALDVARLAARPDFFVGAGMASRGGFDGVATLRFGVELPLWSKSKQAPLARAAERELEAARQELAQAELEAAQRAGALTARRQAATRQIERIREAILPRTSETIASARAAYISGRGDFPAMLDALDLWLESRIALARRESERLAAEAELMYLAGTDPAISEGAPHENR
jgi:cobalt-zinc-cadmium efflux system outer membrane protein